MKQVTIHLHDFKSSWAEIFTRKNASTFPDSEDHSVLEDWARGLVKDFNETRTHGETERLLDSVQVTDVPDPADDDDDDDVDLDDEDLDDDDDDEDEDDIEDDQE